MANAKVKILRGNIVYAKSDKELQEINAGYVVIRDGVIDGVYSQLPTQYQDVVVEDFQNDVIIPAFSDLHVHAPQYPQRGLAMDKILAEWLDQYTFPLEEKYANLDFATQVYDSFCDDLIANGTFHVAIYGTIHTEATSHLIERLEKKGLYAYVGKVNMDQNCPDGLKETVEDSLLETERFLQKYASNVTAKPILTPRFAPTCTQKLLCGLGKLAQKYQVGVQTHLVESLWEAQEAKRLFPDVECDTEIYEKAGLLGYGPFIGGHFIFPSNKDVEILKKYNGIAVHCPDATVNVIAGIMPFATLASQGVKIGLGSDIAAGHNLGIYTQVAKTVQLSKIKSFYEEGHSPVSFAQAFYHATKVGGALFGKVGSIEQGYEANLLVVKNTSDHYQKLSPIQSVERFCHVGQPNQIVARFLRGEKIQ
ncbi:MAG: amidohydrolase family protein [Clostridia bacterium]|nr:amidohydrolase family protein [Clostridia bacterium]